MESVKTEYTSKEIAHEIRGTQEVPSGISLSVVSFNPGVEAFREGERNDLDADVVVINDTEGWTNEESEYSVFYQSGEDNDFMEERNGIEDLEEAIEVFHEFIHEYLS